jgi:hypothetical protein
MLLDFADPFKLIGALGLILIIVGVEAKRRKNEDLFFILGGIALAIYSIYIQDIIFIVLEIVFVLTSSYKFLKVRKSKN